jgi:HEPN domain-containing protein
MIKSGELRKIARARLKDAEVLFRAKRYDGSAYICGYAVEIALKARIREELHWTGFPEKPSEFKDKENVKTHNLDVLLKLLGRKAMDLQLLDQWSIIKKWRPEDRYKPIGSAKKLDAKKIISAARDLLRII